MKFVAPFICATVGFLLFPPMGLFVGLLIWWLVTKR